MVREPKRVYQVDKIVRNLSCDKMNEASNPDQLSLRRRRLRMLSLNQYFSCELTFPRRS